MTQRRVWMTVVFLVTGGLGLFYFGCTSPQNTNSNTNAVALASPEPTPDKASITAELTRIENDWPRILKERDAAGVSRVEADDVLLIYPDGTAGNKDQDMKDIGAGSLTADSWEVSDITVNVLNNDSAVVRLRTTVKGGKYKTPAGKTQDISGQYRSLDTFARRNGQWVMVASATVPVQVPTAEPSPAKPSPTVKPSPTPKATPAARSSPPRKPQPSPKPAASLNPNK